MSTRTVEVGDTRALLEDADRALETALRLGADDAAILVEEGRSTEFTYRDGAIEKAQESATKVLGASLYVDGRYSSHQSNDLRPESLEAFLRDGIALTRALEPDPHRRLPDPALYAGRTERDLGLWDDAFVRLRRAQVLDWLQEMDAAAHAHADVISATGQVAYGHGALARVTSNGFRGSRRGTSGSAYAVVTVRDEGDKRPEAYAWTAARHEAELEPPAGIGRRALERACRRKGSAKAPSARTTMVLHREAAGGLIGRVCGALSGAAIQQERSFLRTRKNERIGSALLSLTDDPWLVGGLASRDFDGEGLATRPRPVIDEGRLETFFVSTYYGNKLGWAPTTAGPSNLVFRPGTRDAAGLIAEAGEGIYVTGWAGGNADPTTGDFSFGLQGHRIRDGKLAEPVSEMNVTGSYLELLPRLVAVGNDPLPCAALRSPTLVFEDVQFSGS